MFFVIKKWSIFCAVGALLLLLCFGWVFRYGQAVQTGSMGRHEVLADRVWIIDAGHGGEDGGAVSQDGTVEAHINLAVAEKLNALLQMMGGMTEMTRVEDISIHDPDCTTLREKKASDLKNRAELCASIANSALISVHQNSLPGSEGVRGAQVFYSPSSGSRELAESIQRSLNDMINGDRPKTAKEIGTEVYLLNHVDCPAVIVECGFLSNREEAALLKDDSYQRLLSLAIADGIWKVSP